MKRKRLALCLTTGVAMFLVASGTFLSAYYRSDSSAQLLDQGKATSTFFRANEFPEHENVGGEGRTQPLPPVEPFSRLTTAPSLQDAESTSAYQVIAIFDGQNDEKSSAVIITNGVEIGQYRVGEVLPAQHVLYAISPNHVVIHDRGGLHTVPLSSHADKSLLDQEQQPPSSPAVKAAARPFSIISPAHFSAENITENREKLLKINDLTPVSDTSASGYIIGERFYPKVLKKVGAAPGDTIVSVNGYNVGNEAGDLQAAESFRRNGSAFLIILTQEGRHLMLEYP